MGLPSLNLCHHRRGNATAHAAGQEGPGSEGPITLPGAPRRLLCQRSNQRLNVVSKLKAVSPLEHQVPPQVQQKGQFLLGSARELEASRFMPRGGRERGRQTGATAERAARGFPPPFYYSFPLIFI